MVASAYGPEILSGLAIATATTAWRAFLALQSTRGLLADDYLIIVANTFWWLNLGLHDFIGDQYTGVNLGNAYLTDEERSWFLPGGQLESQAHDFKVVSVLLFFGWYISIIVVWSLKLSVLVFFARMMGQVPAMKAQLQAATVFWTTTLLVMVLYLHLKCVPISKNWQLWPNPGTACQPGVSTTGIYLLNLSDGAMDVALVGIALDFMRRAGSTITVRQRVILSVVFSLGLGVIGLEVAIIYALEMNDYVSSGQWRMRRTWIEIFLANLPSLYPSLLRGTRRLRDYLLTLRPKPHQTTTDSTQPPRIDVDIETGFPLEDVAPPEAPADGPNPSRMTNTTNPIQQDDTHHHNTTRL